MFKVYDIYVNLSYIYAKYMLSLYVKSFKSIVHLCKF
jgi:hypothetical protein